MEKYTLPELVQRVNKEFFTPQDVCLVLGADPQKIRTQARKCPESLGFPVIIVGNRVKIPRIPFLRYMGVVI